MFGDFFALLIERQGIKLDTLASLCGLSQGHLSMLKNNQRNPTPKTLKKLAPHLNISYEELMAAAGYLTPNEGEVWEEIKQQVIFKDRDVYINKIAEKIAQQHQIDPIKARDKIIHVLDNFDKLPMESQIELISSLVLKNEYKDQGDALVIRAFPPKTNGIKEPSSQYYAAETINLKDEVDREVQAFHEKGIPIDRASAQKIVEHRRRVMQGEEAWIKYIQEAKGIGDALERLAELDSSLSFDDETMLRYIRKAKEKFGLPKPVETDLAAHGPKTPGTGVFDNEGNDKSE